MTFYSNNHPKVKQAIFKSAYINQNIKYMKTFEADNKTGVNHEGVYPNQPLKYLTVSSIIGDQVQNPAGQHLGHIKDIMIDLSSGRIEYVVIEMGGFLGIGEKFFAIPYPLLTVNPKREIFILSQSKGVLENAPGFNKEHWPETNTHEFDRAGSYWGDFMGASTGAVPY